MSKKALGKGLGAFIPEEFSILKDERFAELDVEDVKPNPFQPRMKFDDQTIEEELGRARRPRGPRAGGHDREAQGHRAAEAQTRGAGQHGQRGRHLR